VTGVQACALPIWGDDLRAAEIDAGALDPGLLLGARRLEDAAAGGELEERVLELAHRLLRGEQTALRRLHLGHRRQIVLVEGEGAVELLARQLQGLLLDLEAVARARLADFQLLDLRPHRLHGGLRPALLQAIVARIDPEQPRALLDDAPDLDALTQLDDGAGDLGDGLPVPLRGDDAVAGRARHDGEGLQLQHSDRAAAILGGPSLRRRARIMQQREDGPTP